eukprot:737975-Rhodomonas_salina.1
MAFTPRWKENPLCKLKPKDGVLVDQDDWTTWTLPSTYKFNVMEYPWFIPASESLILVNDKFNYFVFHPTPEILTDTTFKKAVITYLSAHCMIFTQIAQNTNPASDAKYLANYVQITSALHCIQSQLSDACSEFMQSIFTEEALHKHPLKAMCVWKRMSDSVFKVLPKDSRECMANLQKHVMHIPAWELSDLDVYVKRMEVLLQDLLRAGHTKLITDYCIVANLLKFFTVIPSDAPHCVGRLGVCSAHLESRSCQEQQPDVA